MTPEQRRHAVHSMSFWKEQARAGGLSTRGFTSLLYLEGNMLSNWLIDLRHETSTERAMSFGELLANAGIKSFLPKWAQAVAETALFATAEGGVEEYRELVREGGLDTATERERYEKMSEALGFAGSARKILGTEYAPQAVYGDVAPELFETALRHFVRRALKGKRFEAIFNRMQRETGEKEMKAAKRGVGAIRRKRPAEEAAVDQSVKEFMEGFNDAQAILRESVYAADEPRQMGEPGYLAPTAELQTLMEGAKPDPSRPQPGAEVPKMSTYIKEIFMEEISRARRNWGRRMGRGEWRRGFERRAVDAEQLEEPRQPLEQWPRPIWNQPPE